jgi:hypothetical protein
LQGHVEPHGNEQRQDSPDQGVAFMSIPSVHGSQIILAITQHPNSGAGFPVWI